VGDGGKLEAICGILGASSTLQWSPQFHLSSLERIHFTAAVAIFYWFNWSTWEERNYSLLSPSTQRQKKNLVSTVCWWNPLPTALINHAGVMLHCCRNSVELKLWNQSSACLPSTACMATGCTSWTDTSTLLDTCIQNAQELCLRHQNIDAVIGVAVKAWLSSDQPYTVPCFASPHLLTSTWNIHLSKTFRTVSGSWGGILSHHNIQMGMLKSWDLQRELQCWMELGRLGDGHFRAEEVKGRERECVSVCVCGWMGWVSYNIHIVPPSELSTLIRFFFQKCWFF